MENTTNAGSGDNMSNEQLNALIIKNSVAEYAPIITENLPEVPSPDARIAEAATFVANLVITGPEDKENYKVAKSVKQRVTKWRTAVEAKRKELNRPAIDYKKAIDDEAKRLTSLIVPVEASITAKIDAIEKAIEEARKAEALRRHKLLTDNGWQFTGTWYICGIHNMTADQLTTGTEEQLAAWIEAGVEEKERVEAERIRKEEEEKAAAETARLEKEAAERIAKENEELKAKLAALEAAQKPQPEPVPSAPVPAPEPVQQTVQKLERVLEDMATNGFDTPIDVLGTAVVEPEQVRKEAQTVPGWSHPTPTPEFSAPRVGSVTTFDYSEGFEDCRAQVIALFQDPTPRKRAEFIEAFKNLKPSK